MKFFLALFALNFLLSFTRSSLGTFLVFALVIVVFFVLPQMLGKKAPAPKPQDAEGTQEQDEWDLEEFPDVVLKEERQEDAPTPVFTEKKEQEKEAPKVLVYNDMPEERPTPRHTVVEPTVVTPKATTQAKRRRNILKTLIYGEILGKPRALEPYEGY